MTPHLLLALALGMLIGVSLGLLGGGGSILRGHGAARQVPAGRHPVAVPASGFASASSPASSGWAAAS